MAIVSVVMSALTDDRISVNTSIPLKLLGIWSQHADETGVIHPANDGQQVTDPNFIAKRLGISRSAVFRAYGFLENLGYIQWDRAETGTERVIGRVTGRVRIVVSPSAQA
jgi:hypothetical protein